MSTDSNIHPAISDGSSTETQVNPKHEHNAPTHTGSVRSLTNNGEQTANGPSPSEAVDYIKEPCLCRVVTVNDEPILCKVVGHPTGWAAMAKAIREVDVAKVESHKDDLDNLLLFAGLFSAVITPFIIESYKTLRTDLDPKSSFELLQQIAGQTDSYTIITASGASMFINSTDPAPGSQPFKPTHDDVQVNRLWFASLILTLMTASFAIFVKQWLREWIYTDYTSAKARLRIRHFRRPGIEKYRVFEIAAVLPLLLQIALGLFFIGLCYFTSPIHPDLVRISIKMVAVWTLIIGITIILSFIFPQCPYKLVILNSLFRWLRVSARGLRKHAKHPPDFHEETGVVDREDNDLDILVKVDSIQADDQLLTTAIKDCVKQINPPPYQIIDFLLASIAHRARIEEDELRTSPFDLTAVSIPESVWGMVAQLSLEALGDRRPNQNVQRQGNQEECRIISPCFLFVSALHFPVQRPSPNNSDERQYSALKKHIETEPLEIGRAFGNIPHNSPGTGKRVLEVRTFKDILLGSLLSVILEEIEPSRAVYFMAGLLDTRQHIWRKEPDMFSENFETIETQGTFQSGGGASTSEYPQTQGVSASGSNRRLSSPNSKSEGSLLSAMLAPVLKAYLQDLHHHRRGIPEDDMPVFFKAFKIILYQANIPDGAENTEDGGRVDSNEGNRAQDVAVKEILDLYIGLGAEQDHWLENQRNPMTLLLDFLLGQSIQVGVPDGETMTLGCAILSWFKNLQGDWSHDA
ncbi:hypothetical protein EW026_g1219 [Hermanssonia centrifuga]|uniref:DUF6535 domain-containing protein n=1 Tax=Hermanssonia centrifuga TaxID=98765 RepID=A0A4S4KS49_9APHY|nr:hypothetical protein EW026_g1219 [Hermanssonia centrifuga]